MPAWTPLPIDWSQARYRLMAGVGGIGKGSFFELQGNHTLGREESRSGHFLDRRDYCKLHIIGHYVQTLLGPGFTTLPIGFVGEDDAGREMLQEMAAAGMDLSFVQALPGEQTMTSICLVYPDGSGGNLTVDDSANDKVNPAVVEAAFTQDPLGGARNTGIVLAAPEVSLEARRKLLELGRRRGFYNVLAVNSAEAAAPEVEALFEQADLLSLNLDEAAAVCRAHGEAGEGTPEAVVERSARILSGYGFDFTITGGRQGSWAYAGTELHHLPRLKVQAVSTAGAGDAFLAGLIVGRVAGLNFFESHELARLVAALSVTSPHTIHPGIDRYSLRNIRA